jgi:enoyl-[acyl-carrier protein] reductase I
MTNLLDGKKALIFGVANKYSIAWAITQTLRQHGAEVALSYADERLARRVLPLADEVGAALTVKCDVQSDEEIAATFDTIQKQWGSLDILVHAIAYADRADLNDHFYNTSRAGFAQALDISAYSLVALARAARPLLQVNGGSILTLSYYGAEKVVPRYNVMGVAKAALEASVRYLAAELGADNIRVNALSPGPIKTLSAGAFRGFREMLAYTAERTPLRRNVDQDDVARSALWLASELASGVTGEVIHVDAGFHVLGMPEPIEKTG